MKDPEPKDEAVAAGLPVAAKLTVAAHAVATRLGPAVPGESVTTGTARVDAALYKAKLGDRDTVTRI